METWIIFRLNPYGIPRIEQREIQAYDIQNAITMSGIMLSEIICVKLKITEQAIAGL